MSPGRLFRAAFQSLSNRNYRLYFTGQCISVTGTWMQRVGQGWLVLEMTGSGRMLGLVSALQSLPFLMMGTWNGLLADRVNTRRLLLVTQTVAGLQALALAILVATGLVEVWMVLVLGFSLGLVNSLDNPARQTFVSELVGREHIANAVTLNSVAQNVGRAIGPSVAGILIAAAGTSTAFFVNSASYAAVVVALVLMRITDLNVSALAPKAKGQVREGFQHVVKTPGLLIPLVLLTASGLLASDLQIKLPLLAVQSFGGDAQTYGLMLSMVGIGAIFGGFVVAGLIVPDERSLLVTAVMSGVALLLASITPQLWMIMVMMVAIGASNIAFTSAASSMIQMQAEPRMRGRVLALSSLAQRGTSPISAPISGAMGDLFGARVALGVGGVAMLAVTSVIRGRRLMRPPPDTREEKE